MIKQPTKTAEQLLYRFVEMSDQLVFQAGIDQHDFAVFFSEPGRIELIFVQFSKALKKFVRGNRIFKRHDLGHGRNKGGTIGTRVANGRQGIFQRKAAG